MVLAEAAGGGRHEGWHEAEIVIETGCVAARLPVHLTDADLTPGQRADCTRLEPLMDKIRVPRGARTLYDKRGYVHLGTVTAAALLVRIRSEPEPKPRRGGWSLGEDGASAQESSTAATASISTS
ncbi:hypothetical protein [Streptomyces sp. NRRL F-2747]|uniref:hypothetical protein n=1 Tax=Streptomyces sp. NPDC085665 TaxID=3365735 RepID=UPI0004C91512